MCGKRILHCERGTTRAKRTRPSDRPGRLRKWLVKHGVAVRQDGLRLCG